VKSPAAKIFRTAITVALLSVGVAFAQTPPYDYPITVGTSQVQVLQTDNARRRVTFQNPNATAIVAVCLALSRVDSAPITCAVHGAGSITILPGATFSIDGAGQNGPIPSPWNAISDTPSSALSILEFE
jgi:hypothetical protein